MTCAQQHKVAGTTHPRSSLLGWHGDVKTIGSFEPLHRASNYLVHEAIEAQAENPRHARPMIWRSRFPSHSRIRAFRVPSSDFRLVVMPMTIVRI